MRTRAEEGIEDKAVRPTWTLATCPQRKAHRLFAGGACPTCGTQVTPGPYSPAQFKTYFAETVVAPSVDPAIAANPPSPELLAAETEAERAGEAVQQAAFEVAATAAAIQKLRVTLSNDIDSAAMTLRIPDPTGVANRADAIAALRLRQRDEEAEVEKLQTEHEKVLLRLNALRRQRDDAIRAAMAGLPTPLSRGQRFVATLRSITGG